MNAALLVLLVLPGQAPAGPRALEVPAPQAFLVVVYPLPGVPGPVTPRADAGERSAVRPAVTEGRGDGVELVCGRGGLRARLDLQFGGRGYGGSPYGYAPPVYGGSPYGYSAPPWASSPYGYSAPPWASSPYGYGNGYGNGNGGFDLSGQFGGGAPVWGRGFG